MARAKRLCSTRRCPTVVPRGQRDNRCDECRRKAEQARGTAHQRGYDHTHADTFRADVLARHPICQRCLRVRSTVADHWPLSRRELVARDLDPNDPVHGRGLCAACHGIETANNQPGGWNATDQTADDGPPGNPWGVPPNVDH